jgi:hypothetical protein
MYTMQKLKKLMAVERPEGRKLRTGFTVGEITAMFDVDGRADGSGVAAAGTAGRAGRCADDAVDCVPRAAFGAA